MTYIRVIPPEQAEGDLKVAYEKVRSDRGDIANIFQAHSIRPDTMVAHLHLYMTMMFGNSGLTRAERELLAVVVSSANNCSYCVLHHSEALRKYEKDPKLVQRLGTGEIPDDLPPRSRALATYARKVTRQSFAVEEQDIEALRHARFSDEEILTANLIASYYNFVNRLADGLGVDLEPRAQNYKY